MNIYKSPNMVSKEEVEKIWNQSEKVQIRVSIPKYIADLIDTKALEDWRLDRAARAKEVTKLILESQEKE